MRFQELKTLLFFAIYFADALVDDSLTEIQCQDKNQEILKENGATRERAQNLFLTCKNKVKRRFLAAKCGDVANIYATFQLADEIVLSYAYRFQFEGVGGKMLWGLFSKYGLSKLKISYL